MVAYTHAEVQAIVDIGNEMRAKYGKRGTRWGDALADALWARKISHQRSTTNSAMTFWYECRRRIQKQHQALVGHHHERIEGEQVKQLRDAMAGPDALGKGMLWLLGHLKHDERHGETSAKLDAILKELQATNGHLQKLATALG